MFGKVIHMSEKYTPKPKPRAPKPSAAEKPVKIYDAVLEPVEAEVEVEVVEEATVEGITIFPETPAADTLVTIVPSTRYAVVGNETTDYVYASKAIFQNRLQKKSLTVHHLQRRLAEWGHPDAYTDLDGWYGEPTKKSVAEFQARNNLEATGIADYATLELLFEGDTNVTLIKE